jgi:hypothetical protein
MALPSVAQSFAQVKDFLCRMAFMCKAHHVQREPVIPHWRRAVVLGLAVFYVAVASANDVGYAAEPSHGGLSGAIRGIIPGALPGSIRGTISGAISGAIGIAPAPATVSGTIPPGFPGTTLGTVPPTASGTISITPGTIPGMGATVPVSPTGAARGGAP